MFVRGVVRALEMFSQSFTCQLGVPDAKNITVGCVCVCAYLRESVRARDSVCMCACVRVHMCV